MRYAFPRFGEEVPFVIFFKQSRFSGGSGIAFTHVIGEGSVWYASSVGEMRFGPIGSDDPTDRLVRKLGIQFDVENQPCAAP